MIEKLAPIAQLARRARLGPVVGYARNLVERTAPETAVDVDGMRFYGKSIAQRVYLQTLRTGRERHTGRLFARAIRDDSVVIDVGAYVGVFTVDAARRAPRGQVYSFEPDPATFCLLERNIEANCVSDQVIARQEAIADVGGFRPLFQHTRNDSRNSLLKSDDTTDGPRVRCASLDALLPQGLHVDVIKIDAEGAELEVLAGMSRTLTTSGSKQVVIVESNPHALKSAGHGPGEIVDCLRGHGFEVSVIDDDAGELTAAHELTLEHCTNLYCTRG